MTEQHPAAMANQKSFAAVEAKDKNTWLSLFAEDAVVEDPVGISAIDPTGKGHRGKEAISTFWDMVIANGDLSFNVHKRIPRGSECAVLASLSNRMPSGQELVTEMIVIYRVNDAGKIISLRAFWDYDSLEQKVQDLMQQG